MRGLTLWQDASASTADLQQAVQLPLLALHRLQEPVEGWGVRSTVPSLLLRCSRRPDVHPPTALTHVIL